MEDGGEGAKDTGDGVENFQRAGLTTDGKDVRRDDMLRPDDYNPDSKSGFRGLATFPPR